MLQVSIMQIASDKMVFIFDLIKLYKDVPDVLDKCLSRILKSPRILKLGMNICLVEEGEILCSVWYNLYKDLTCQVVLSDISKTMLVYTHLIYYA